MNWLAIAFGGALGSMLRFFISTQISLRAHDSFPLGTLTVNVIGSFLIGALYVLMTERMVNSEPIRLFVIVGLLGGFTTFSTFSLETVHLIESGLWMRALLNIIASVCICVSAAFGGVWLVRWLN